MLNRLTDLTYAEKWETPIGKDCISLCSTLARWLGERLVHLGTHTKCYPITNAPMAVQDKFDTDTMLAMWKHELLHHGAILVRYAEDNEDTMEYTLALHADADASMTWVACNWQKLWD